MVMWGVFGLWLLCGVAAAFGNRERYSVASLASLHSFEKTGGKDNGAFLGPWVRRLIGRARGDSEGGWEHIKGRRSRGRGRGEKRGDARGDFAFEVLTEGIEGRTRQGSAVTGQMKGTGGGTQAHTRLYSHNQSPAVNRRGRSKAEKQQQQGSSSFSVPLPLPPGSASASTPSVSGSPVPILMGTSMGEKDVIETDGVEEMVLTLWQPEPGSTESLFAENVKTLLPVRRCLHSVTGKEVGGKQERETGELAAYEILIPPQDVLSLIGQQMANGKRNLSSCIDRLSFEGSSRESPEVTLMPLQSPTPSESLQRGMEKQGRTKIMQARGAKDGWGWWFQKKEEQKQTKFNFTRTPQPNSDGPFQIDCIGRLFCDFLGVELPPPSECEDPLTLQLRELLGPRQDKNNNKRETEKKRNELKEVDGLYQKLVELSTASLKRAGSETLDAAGKGLASIPGRVGSAVQGARSLFRRGESQTVKGRGGSRETGANRDSPGGLFKGIRRFFSRGVRLGGMQEEGEEKGEEYDNGGGRETRDGRNSETAGGPRGPPGFLRRLPLWGGRGGAVEGVEGQDRERQEGEVEKVEGEKKTKGLGFFPFLPFGFGSMPDPSRLNFTLRLSSLEWLEPSGEELVGPWEVHEERVRGAEKKRSPTEFLSNIMGGVFGPRTKTVRSYRGPTPRNIGQKLYGDLYARLKFPGPDTYLHCLDQYESRETTAEVLLEQAMRLCEDCGRPDGGEAAVEAHMDNLILPLFGDNAIALTNAQSRSELEREYRTFLKNHPKMLTKYAGMENTPQIVQIRQKAFQRVSNFGLLKRLRRSLPWANRGDVTEDTDQADEDDEALDLSLTVASPIITPDVPPVDQTSCVVNREMAQVRASSFPPPPRSSAGLTAEKRLEMQRRKMDPLSSPPRRGLDDVRMCVSSILEGCEEGTERVMECVAQLARDVQNADAAVQDARKKGRPSPRYIPSVVVSEKDSFNSALCHAARSLQLAYQYLQDELQDMEAFSSRPSSSNSAAEKREEDLERVEEFFFCVNEFGEGLSGNPEVSRAVREVCEGVRRDAGKPFDPEVFFVSTGTAA
uniref:Uncharacterized protein n=1 Tax=Chromera velia CCMP2878 TaxID=1169474 RepID=A0A0G4H9V0_9ALVE|eukprot:Cvel_25491.t1-p1 / transcript=Cvel_25491.t1 / gene=Cvel_25491 / organism=Chromera_velia_CCMP2878 / gene_product=hypothetical protein / transcript_product=hypothetical protein / location=Cvel_scaffold2896:14322-17687(+) / protein_length=1071 / sequence_SO=supercontig / SO=protein_coding / is_pseudo=false